MKCNKIISLQFFLCAAFVTNGYAQQSANPELDACAKNEQVSLALKGAGIGAIAGFLSGGKKEDAVKKAAAGALVGGAAGFATAYFTANKACFKKNPNWIPESELKRTQDFEQVKKEYNYKPTDGIKTIAEKLKIPSKAKAESFVEVISEFVLMTPDGAESQVTIDRKLFIIQNGNETQLPFYGKDSEQRTVELGRHQNLVRLPIPKAESGTQYRVEFSVSADGKPASTINGTVTVE